MRSMIEPPESARVCPFTAYFPTKQNLDSMFTPEGDDDATRSSCSVRKGDGRRFNCVLVCTGYAGHSACVQDASYSTRKVPVWTSGTDCFQF
jgi:hypothetical protein